MTTEQNSRWTVALCFGFLVSFGVWIATHNLWFLAGSATSGLGVLLMVASRHTT